MAQLSTGDLQQTLCVPDGFVEVAMLLQWQGRRSITNLILCQTVRAFPLILFATECENVVKSVCIYKSVEKLLYNEPSSIRVTATGVVSENFS